METQTMQNLLQQVSSISKKYEEIAKITGENFNVFIILKVAASEVRTHSAFLAELLNPQGSHGQGDVFLKSFVDKFQFRKNSFDTKLANVEVEKFTGFKNEDSSEGGRIDIMITDTQKNRIIIENKIYASDQEKQLLRYHKFGEAKSDLFYLTLDGNEPTGWSTDEKIEIDKDFKTLSYKTDIKEWLELCRKEAVNHSLLRETITQYINLIKHLTGQTINNNMEKEIVKTICASSENIEAAFQIADSIDQVKARIMEKLEQDIRNELANNPELQVTVEFSDNLGKRDTGIAFNKKEWNNCKISFDFENDFENMFVGIYTENSDNLNNLKFKEMVQQNLSKINKGKFLNHWMWANRFDAWDESWTTISNGEVAKKIISTVKEIIKNLEGVEL